MSCPPNPAPQNTLTVREIISGMTGMVKTHLETFIKNTGKKPEKIIMFRDGVSEGQYGQVVQYVYLLLARDVN
jgi:hypothetical protein